MFSGALPSQWTLRHILDHRWMVQITARISKSNHIQSQRAFRRASCCVVWFLGRAFVWSFFVYLVVGLVPSWKGCGRVEDGHRLFNPVALSRRSATALEQLGCQVDWWMGGLNGGPESCPKRPPHPLNICNFGVPNLCRQLFSKKIRTIVFCFFFLPTSGKYKKSNFPNFNLVSPPLGECHGESVRIFIEPEKGKNNFLSFDLVSPPLGECRGKSVRIFIG